MVKSCARFPSDVLDWRITLGVIRLCCLRPVDSELAHFLTDTKKAESNAAWTEKARAVLFSALSSKTRQVAVNGGCHVVSGVVRILNKQATYGAWLSACMSCYLVTLFICSYWGFLPCLCSHRTDNTKCSLSESNALYIYTVFGTTLLFCS